MVYLELDPSKRSADKQNTVQGTVDILTIAIYVNIIMISIIYNIVVQVATGQTYKIVENIFVKLPKDILLTHLCLETGIH